MSGPGLTAINPEFRRNLWIEFSTWRLIAMPVVLGLLLLGGHAMAGREGLDAAAVGGLIALTVIWGTRQAAGAVSDEVRAGTWDAQRMSSLGPWTMTWGKLLGVTAYTWYGAAFCVLAVLLTGQTGPAETLNMLLTAVTAQAAAFFIGLLVQQTTERGGADRLSIGTAQVLAIGVALWLVSRDWYWSGETVLWWSLAIDGRVFVLVSQGLVLVWVLAGIHALMRSELRYPPQPWTWLAFLIFAPVYAAGFANAMMVAEWAKALVAVPIVPLLAALGTLGGLTLLSALVVPQSSVTLRRWLAAPTPARGRPRGLLTEAPAFALALAMTLGTAAALGVVWLGAPSPTWLPVTVASGLLFLLRDLAVVLTLTLDAPPRRGPLGALLALAVLYGLLPMALDPVLPAADLLYPRWGPSAPIAIVPALVQAGVAVAVLAWRWRSVGRPPSSSATRSP